MKLTETTFTISALLHAMSFQAEYSSRPAREEKNQT